MFSQDSGFQYDVKMLSQNRFDKFSLSTYIKLAEAHQKYSQDPIYVKSPFYTYMTLAYDLLASNTVKTNYSLFIQKINEINESNSKLISQISSESIL